MERHYSVREAAERLGYSPDYLRDRLIGRGQLGPVIQRIVGGPIRIPESTIQAFLAAATRMHHRLQSGPRLRSGASSSMSAKQAGRIGTAIGGLSAN